MKKNIYSVLCFMVFFAGGISAAFAQSGTLSTATFEDLQLESESYWFYNPDEAPSTFKSGSFSFNNNWADYGGFIYWEAFAYSNLTLGVNDLDDPDIQYGNAAGQGTNGSSTFAVAFWSSFGTAPVITLDEPAVVQGVYLNNCLYAYSSMANGDNYAGGPFEQGDFLKVIFMEATIASDETEILPTVECYLADYRSENPSDHYILTEWKWFDLSELGAISALTFSVEGSRTGDYGLNTPAYLCMDNLGASNPTNIPTVSNKLQSHVYAANGTVFIQTTLSDYQVRVYSPAGGLIYEASGKRNSEIDASAWSKGIYIVEIISDKGKEAKKVVR